MKRPTLLIIFIFVTILGLALWQVGMANEISTTGAELAQIQKQVDDYKRENAVLREEYLSMSSFTNIAEKAEELGYIEAKTTVSLNGPLPLALR